jgi:hypothetical protein
MEKRIPDVKKETIKSEFWLAAIANFKREMRNPAVWVAALVVAVLLEIAKSGYEEIQTMI